MLHLEGFKKYMHCRPKEQQHVSWRQRQSCSKGTGSAPVAMLLSISSPVVPDCFKYNRFEALAYADYNSFCRFCGISVYASHVIVRRDVKVISELIKRQVLEQGHSTSRAIALVTDTAGVDEGGTICWTRTSLQCLHLNLIRRF